MNNEIVENKFCFGCSACYNICPKKAIEMKPDNEGFLQPTINHNICINCNLCKVVCPALSKESIKRTTIKAFALQHKNDDIRKNSASGAAFVAISDVILDSGGVVYGVVYDSSFKAIHCRAVNKFERNKMCGSKYVQSEIGTVFNDLMSDLRNDLYVLFTGTSCQVHGLLSFLARKKIDTSKLLTCDIICHGVPSPLIWKSHIKYLEEKSGKKIASYSNRSKVNGWHGHNECVTYTDGSFEWFSKKSQNFKDLFYGHYIVRECCHSCPYVNMHSKADFTIADFWGCEDLMPIIDDNKGTSIVLLNSTNAILFFQKIQSFVNCWEVQLSDAIRFNHTKPTKANKNRSQFWKDYYENGYGYVVKKYAGDSVFGKVKYYIKKILRKILVKFHVIHI